MGSEMRHRGKLLFTNLPLAFFFSFLLFKAFSTAEDPSFLYNIEVSYITASPLGVSQQVIAINDMFPGPVFNVTTNDNILVNVRNNLDETFLIHWSGIQQRGSSSQDGVLGTNCPIPPKWNWTYQFQVKDQIGSFFYFPSLHLQRAAGGFGAFIINNLPVISPPFDTPHGDIVIFIGDWYTHDHTVLRNALDRGEDLGIPDGVLINGKGPYRYNDAIVPDGIDYERIQVEAGKTYRFRVHNVGVSTSLNFRIQSHSLVLAETEGSYTLQKNYSGFDIHVGQSYSFLITMDQDAIDYYIVASARFVNESLWKRVTGVGILHYTNSKGDARGPLPPGPDDQYGKTYSINQARSIRWNVTASGARQNPQINVTETYVLENKPLVKVDRKRRAALNGISFVNPSTPIGLADRFKVKGVYKLDFPSKPLTGPPQMKTSIINGTYRGSMEIILQNHNTKMYTYHLSGYSFFVVGMDFGDWSETSRGTYQKWDGIARSTTQVYPGAWTAILVHLDSTGVWNIRTDNLDAWYLGQETYIKVVNPEPSTNKTELPIPDNVFYCGALASMQTPQDIGLASSNNGNGLQLIFCLLMFVLATIPL